MEITLPIRKSIKRAFFTILAAQFFSSLADTALLIAAIALIAQLDGPVWMTPAVRQGFAVSYVLLAAFAGAFADSFPKGRVMLMTNAIKIIGCFVIFFFDILLDFQGICSLIGAAQIFSH